MEKNLEEKTIKMLIENALNMLNFSYVPYSHFHVGAALLTTDDELYTGCNIESASYGATNCAERTAIFKAVSEGKKHFKAIAIVGGAEGKVTDYCPPCGICRQVMKEFCSNDFPVVLAKSVDEYRVFTLDELLPQGFGPGDLGVSS